ncbi:MAG: L-histidine N(alpha)-methyltransferase [Propionibacteriaceae bacterium]
MTTYDLEVHLDDDHLARELRSDVRLGLSARPRSLPPKWFYDDRGSELFDQITELAEYYPTRAERAVLTEHAVDIAELTGAKTLVELGSGSSEKTRLLLDALTAHGTLGTFTALDVSESALRNALSRLAVDYPKLQVTGVVGDFTQHLPLLPHGGTRLVAFLGGTIGNLLPAERAEFLAALHATLEPGEWLLLGTDLVKDPGILVPAYDDAAGVTADFNRNVLRVLNRELGADFDESGFDHVALWDARQEWIEMRLRARRAMQVSIPALDLTVDFTPGEELRTEVSAKFRPSGVTKELAAAGFELREWWTDPDGLFGVSLSQRRPG